MFSKPFFPALATFALCASLHAESFVALDFGLSSTKPFLGASWFAGKNEFNAGLKSFAWSGSGEHLLAPGIGYNRAFTDNGWYAGVAYSPEYKVEDVFSVTTVAGVSTVTKERQKGWNAGDLSLGLGKQFQWTSWGLNIDGSVLTPADKNFGKDWGFWIGAGASYRFKLD